MRALGKGWPPVPQRDGKSFHEPQEKRGWCFRNLVLTDFSSLNSSHSFDAVIKAVK